MSNDLFQRTGIVMGGPWQIRITPAPGLDCEAAAQAGLDALELVNTQMSTYQDSSDLMRLNHAPLDQWIDIPGDLHTVLAEADRLAQMTDGALNVALGGLVNAWGFGPDPTPDRIPQAAQERADAARAALGSFALRGAPAGVLKTAPVQFDLCAVAKGFAVDQAARALRGVGAQGFMVEAAGEVFAQGARPDGSPWGIGLELPIPERRVIYDQITLDGGGLATSGQYRNRRDIAGQGVGHTISPQTGLPLDTTLLSVTVRADSTMRADGLATALLVMGSTKGAAFTETHGIAAQMVCHDPNGAKVVSSEAWVKQAQMRRADMAT